MNSIAWLLSKLRFPLAVNLGGTGKDTTEGLLTDLKTAGAYTKTNVLGVVSQTAGVPTGAVIERGNNANGDYIKYADGTLICAFKYDASAMAITSAIGNLFQAGQEATWTFPSTFSLVPVVHLTAGRNDGTVILGAMLRSVSANAALWRLWSATPFAAGNVKDVHMTAIGRWY